MKKSANGTIIQETTFTRTDGTKGEVGNLNFTSNAFYREYLTPLTLTDTALALPDMQGSGMVRVNNQDFINTRRVA